MKQTLIAKVDPIALVEITGSYHQDPLIISIYGDEGGGKSRLIGTAPDPIGIVPFEYKSRASILKTANELGKRVIAPEIDLIRTQRAMMIATLRPQCVVPEDSKFNAYTKFEDKAAVAAREMQELAKKIRIDDDIPECCQQHYYRWHVNRSKSVIFRMSERDDIRTIGIDTFGQLVEDINYANYGRTGVKGFEKKELNQEVRDLLNNIAHKNVILTHHSKDVWNQGRPTGKTAPMSSFSKIGHYTSVMLKMNRNRDATGDQPRYILRVEDCQANASIIGQDLFADDMITFQNIAMAVYPDADPDFWE